MTREIKIVEGLVARDIFGSWDDCSPGLYVDSDTVETLFSGYEGKRVRITIEEVDLRPNVAVTIFRSFIELLKYGPLACSFLVVVIRLFSGGRAPVHSGLVLVLASGEMVAFRGAVGIAES